MIVLIVAAGLLAALGALGVVLSPRPIHSALSLVFSIGMLAVIFLALNAQFLFAVQLIVYAGAVMVLFVFIIALLSPSSEDRPRSGLRTAIAFGGLVVITSTFVALAHNGVTYSGTAYGAATQFRGQAVGTTTDATAPYAVNAFAFNDHDVNAAGNVQTVGGQLFTVFVLPFEITSLLLLVAAIGAVYLTRRTTASEA